MVAPAVRRRSAAHGGAAAPWPRAFGPRHRRTRGSGRADGPAAVACDSALRKRGAGGAMRRPRHAFARPRFLLCFEHEARFHVRNRHC